MKNDGQFDTIPEPLVLLSYRELVRTIQVGLAAGRICRERNLRLDKTDFTISVADDLLRIIPGDQFARLYVINLLADELRAQLLRSPEGIS